MPYVHNLTNNLAILAHVNILQIKINLLINLCKDLDTFKSAYKTKRGNLLTHSRPRDLLSVPFNFGLYLVEMLPKFIVGLILCWGVQSFPDGAPIDTCVKNRANQPNHGQHRTQPLSSLPYRVLASALLYGPNTPVTVTIEGAEPFKGFFLQARSVENDNWIGAWEPAPNTTVHPECSSITHGDPEFKTRATLLWRAPPDAHGKVYFTGTVLKNYGTFWSNLIAEAPQDPRQLQILG